MDGRRSEGVVRRLRGAVAVPDPDLSYPTSLRQALERAHHVEQSILKVREAAPVRLSRIALRDHELYVSCVCDDWRSGKVTEAEAVSALHRYMDRFFGSEEA